MGDPESTPIGKIADKLEMLCLNDKVSQLKH